MKLYYDIETGLPLDPPIEIPDICSSRLIDKDGKPLGRVMIFGTMGGDSSCHEAFKEIFYNPQSYNLKEYGSEE